jgi:polyhydroxybutyrate depolymerase
MLRFVLWLLIGAVALGGIVAALAGYLLYTPNPEHPRLSGTVAAGSMVINGRTRTYQAYVPKGLAPGSPLVLVMHGSGENATAIRIETGYAFERLADARGFAVVYPNGQNGHWNTCEIDRDAQAPGVDDVGFLTALADKFIGEAGTDRNRVFAVGLSEGGYMAIRLALEAPRFRALASVEANLPVPEDFQCKPVTQGAASIILIHGTKDRLVPFQGGEGSLILGLFKNPKVLSSHATAQYFADLDAIAGPPVTTRSMVLGLNGRFGATALGRRSNCSPSMGPAIRSRSPTIAPVESSVPRRGIRMRLKLSGRSSSGSGQDNSGAVGCLQHARRLRDAVALRVVDAEALQHVDDFLILGKFGDGLLAGEMADLVDRTHHLAIDGIVQDLFDKAAVDLQIIDREVLQVSEG